MVYKYIILLLLIGAIVGLLYALPGVVEPSRTILEVRAVPVDGAPDEYILEYSNGRKELLKDGKRLPLSHLK